MEVQTKEIHMRTFKRVFGAVALASLMAPLAMAQGDRPAELKLGIVTFISGSGGVVGGPSVDAAKLIVGQINAAGGVDGVPIKVQYVDEQGGVSHNIANYRQLAENVDAVIGYVSSSDCLAVAPVAEELGMLTILADCTTDSLFEGRQYKWVFRTQMPASSNALAGAMYLAKMKPEVKTITGINPDYAFGRDEWKYFSAAVTTLLPRVELKSPIFTKLFTNNYSSEISRLLAQNADLIYTSFWGGDNVAFVQQGAARGLFKNGRVMMSLITQGDIEGMKAMPDGVMGGSESSYLFHAGAFENPELAQFVKDYHEATGQYPISTYPYTIRRSINALVGAYKKAIVAGGGKWPAKEDIAKAMEGLEVDTVLGKMLIRKDHQASYHEMYGRTVSTPEYPFKVFTDVITFPPELILAPEGTPDVEAWIRSLPPSVLDQVPAPRGS